MEWTKKPIDDKIRIREFMKSFNMLPFDVITLLEIPKNLILEYYFINIIWIKAQNLNSMKKPGYWLPRKEHFRIK